MTTDQIIEFAKQVGFHSASILHIYGGNVDALCDPEIKELEAIQRFAELVRNEVLEECANVCRKEAERALFNWKNDLPANQTFWNGAEQMAAGCANDIASRKALK